MNTMALHTVILGGSFGADVAAAALETKAGFMTPLDCGVDACVINLQHRALRLQRKGVCSPSDDISQLHGRREHGWRLSNATR